MLLRATGDTSEMRDRSKTTRTTRTHPRDWIRRAGRERIPRTTPHASNPPPAGARSAVPREIRLGSTSCEDITPARSPRNARARPIAVLLDTVETLLLRFQSNAAQMASLPAASPRCSGPRLFSLQIPRLDHARRIPLVDGRFLDPRSPHLAAAAFASGHLHLLRTSSVAMDAFLPLARQDRFLERLQRDARGIHLQCSSWPGGRAGSPRAHCAEERALDARNVRRVRSGARVRYGGDRLACRPGIAIV